MQTVKGVSLNCFLPKTSLDDSRWGLRWGEAKGVILQWDSWCRQGGPQQWESEQPSLWVLPQENETESGWVLAGLGSIPPKLSARGAERWQLQLVIRSRPGLLTQLCGQSTETPPALPRAVIRPHAELLPLSLEPHMLGEAGSSVILTGPSGGSEGTSLANRCKWNHLGPTQPRTDKAFRKKCSFNNKVIKIVILKAFPHPKAVCRKILAN